MREKRAVTGCEWGIDPSADNDERAPCALMGEDRRQPVYNLRPKQR
ncbi:hypothetical protein EDWATA_03234 [Edwardsiella tarda ATCC 23685]|uniref:Uncharacterized protein n=1 Tax=Edwardsiella tarda ATCC 23685 TaxID=500638 RepID=D4F8Y0_EDWTA|nr:hypothetical protein EDWATA_03234 [Edwardsiella tarda ATCC 23685]